jgi:hypothetical protein
MPTAADYTEQALIPTLGMYALPYANVYPELVTQLAQLYIGQVAGVPWIPQGWLGEVLALHGRLGFILVPAPSGPGPGRTGAEPIPWLMNAQQRAWWDAFAAKANGVISAYAAKDAAKGAVLLKQLYDNASFWNSAYQVANTLAAPVQIVQNAAAPLASAARTVANAGVAISKSPTAVVAIAAGAGVLLLLLLLRRR